MLAQEDLVTLDRLLLELVRSRIPLPEGLRAFGASVGRGKLRAALDELGRDVESGLPLSEALARRSELPSDYAALVAAGEAAGSVARVLEVLVARAEVEAATRRRFRDALVYPSVTLAATLAGTAAFVLVLAPELRRLYERSGAELPALLAFLAGSGPAVTVALAVLGLAALALAPRLLAAFAARRGADLSVAGFARALGAFLRRGLPSVTAIDALRRVDGELPPGVLDRVLERLEAGSSLARALEPEEALPRGLVRAVAAGEARGDLEPALARVATRAEERFDLLVARLESLLPALFLMALGVVVGTGAVAVLLGVQDLARQLGSY